LERYLEQGPSASWCLSRNYRVSLTRSCKMLNGGRLTQRHSSAWFPTCSIHQASQAYLKWSLWSWIPFSRPFSPSSKRTSEIPPPSHRPAWCEAPVLSWRISRRYLNRSSRWQRYIIFSIASRQGELEERRVLISIARLSNDHGIVQALRWQIKRESNYELSRGSHIRP
jgi:hypothetical protein